MTGTSNRVPRMSTTAPMVTPYSPLSWIPSRLVTFGRPATPVDPSTAAAPTSVSTTPATSTRTLGRGEMLCPRMTPTMSSRPRRLAGARAATRVLPRAHRAMPASNPQRTSSGGVGLKSPSPRARLMTTGVARTPSTVPTRAEVPPRTSACASTVRRSTAVLAPLLAARASVRRCRVALTAKAGPTSRAVMMSSIAAPRPTMRLTWSAPTEVSPWISAGSSLIDGGSSSTCREVTRRP